MGGGGGFAAALVSFGGLPLPLPITWPVKLGACGVMAVRKSAVGVEMGSESVGADLSRNESDRTLLE